MEKIFLIIRKITVPPIFAMALLITLYVRQPFVFSSVGQLLWGIFFLGILPILGYPLQKYIPYFKEKGREGQRSLAMIFSVSGYLLGIITVLIGGASPQLCTVYWDYLLCGILILLCNKVFHRRASGHACGIVTPILLLAHFRIFLPAVIGVFLIIPVFVASLKTKRHTLSQLLGGCAISFSCLILLIL